MCTLLCIISLIVLYLYGSEEASTSGACMINNCQNGATCTRFYGVEFCQCKDGNIGEFCQLKGYPGDREHHFACTNEYFKITCPDHRQIKITDVTWERDRMDPERTHGCTSGNTCYGLDSMDRIKHQCEYRQNCEGYANEELMGPLNCKHTTQRHLKISYACLAQHTELVCENEYVVLQCEPGQTIKVVNAWWGTNEPEVKNSCPEVKIPMGYHVRKDKCILEVSDIGTEPIGQKCNGKEKCTVVATNLAFENNDPCNGLPKNLKIEYNCEVSY